MRWLRWKAFWVRIRWGRWWWLDWILDGREDEIYRRETTGEINEGKYRSKLYNSSMMWRPIMTIIYSCTYSEKFSTKCLSYIHCSRTWKDEEYRLLIPGYIHYTNRHPEDWGTIGKRQSTVFSVCSIILDIYCTRSVFGTLYQLGYCRHIQQIALLGCAPTLGSKNGTASIAGPNHF